MSKELETRKSNVPALAYDPASEITAEDVALPRMKIAQMQTEHVVEGRVQYGAIFSELGRDDPDPTVVAAKEGDPVRFYVLSFYKGLSGELDGQFRSFRYGDPEAPERAQVTYNYVLAVPTADGDIPVKFLLKGKSSNAAKMLNLMLKKANGNSHEVPFELSSKKTKNEKGSFCIAQIRRATVSDAELAEDLEKVNGMLDLVAAPTPVEETVSTEVTDAPAI